MAGVLMIIKADMSAPGFCILDIRTIFFLNHMKALRIIAILLLLFNSTGALFGGWSFINDPTGADLKIPLTYLEHSPFNNFLVPGIVLFTINGLFGLLTLLWTVFERKKYAWLIIIQGILLIGWIIVQMIMLREIYYLQFIFGGIGLVLLLIGITLNRRVNEKLHHEVKTKDARLKTQD